MLIADVDWIEVGALATGIAALVTAGLAAFTAKMASATKEMAEATKAQVELSRRHVAAAETSVEQTARSMDATLDPRFRVQRLTGEQATVSYDASDFSVLLINEGSVAARITEARINLPPQFDYLEAIPSGLIEPSGQVLIRTPGEPWPALQDAASKGATVRFQVTYLGRTGRSVITTFALKHKGESGSTGRWLVVEAEEDKPQGG